MTRTVVMWLVALTGILFQVTAYAQDGDAKVYFLGIGIEKCTTGTPGKQNAVADVQLVMKRTQKDAASGDVNFTHNGSSMMINKAVTFTLFNDDATIDNIDSIINQVIRPVARPHDVLYIYISAQGTGITGGFNVPAKTVAPGKKSKPGLPQRVVLESSHLRELCELLPCQNQILVADAVSWQENHGVIMEQLIVPFAQEKNQIIVAPWAECPDSFLVAGKYVSCFAGSIYNAGQPLLRLLIKNNAITTKVKTSLNNAYNALTGSDDPVVEVYESWKLVTGAIAMKPEVPEQKIAETKADSKSRGVEADPSAEEENAMIAAEQVTNFALIIANQDYRNWSKLYTPISDAQELDKELKEHYGYETRVLINVTLDSLNKEFKALAARKFDSKSQVLVYFAGHGGYDEDLGEGYLVPVDAGDPHSASIMSDVISYGYLLKILDNLSAQHVLVMLDACYSGAFNPQISGNKACPRRSSQAMQSLTMMVNNSMTTRSRCYITSGQLNTVPDGTKHTPFNDAIVNTLKVKWAQNEVAFFEDLIVSVKKLPSKPQDGVFGQNAQGDTGEYFFFPSKLLNKKK